MVVVVVVVLVLVQIAHFCQWSSSSVEGFDVLPKPCTLQGINISHLGKRKLIFKMDFSGGYVSSQEGKTLCFWDCLGW